MQNDKDVEEKPQSFTPETTNNNIDLSQYDEEFQILDQSPFGKIHSHSICHTTSRVVINTADGFAIVHNNKVKSYETTGPFLGKAGVKVSCLLSTRNLIALVPDRNITINSQLSGRLQLQTSCVYIFDINTNSIIYHKNFNTPVLHLHFTSTYLFAGDNKRIIAVKYEEDIKSHRVMTLDECVREFEAAGQKEFVRYLETDCECKGESGCECGKIKASAEEPQIVAYVKNSKKAIGVFVTELDYSYDYESQPYEVFCLSPNGQHLAVVSTGDVNIKIINLKDKQVYTQFRRGYSVKPTLCLGFIDDWFGMVSHSNHYATFHLFQLRPKQQNQVLASKFKIYFSTYSSSVDFMRQNDKLLVISLMGGFLEVLDMRKAKEKYGEHVKKLKPHEIQMWT